MKKVLALLLVVCMFLMSGCIATMVGVQINSDGSGIVSAKIGYTKEALEKVMEISGVSEEEIEAAVAEALAGMKQFTYNGVLYYGEEDSAEFDRLQVFVDAMNQASEGENPMVLTGNADGSISFLFELSPDSAGLNDMENQMQEGVDQGQMTKEDVKKIFEEMVVLYEFTFPAPVKQVSGPTKGVTIDGNKLTIDIIEGAFEMDETEVFNLEFITEPGALVPAKLLFSDVTEDKWYYDAVVKMAKDGVVNGMGDGTFGPESTMTYAQFCQLLAKYMGAEVGEENGYWAGKAIAVCTEQSDLVISRGAITPENYDVPITREAAISAMFLLTGGNAEEFGTVIGIPDEAEISEEYKNNIFAAYVVGITSGVDEAGTFMPKKELTRAEVCQLFYNIWN